MKRPVWTFVFNDNNIMELGRLVRCRGENLPLMLRKKANDKSVSVDVALNLARQMHQLMLENNGIGLAATQVSLLYPIITIDMDEQKYFLLNPTIQEESEKKQVSREGCLSLPRLFLNIRRAQEVCIKAWDLIQDKERVFWVKGGLAACFQHEIDHLNGKVITDYLPPRIRARRMCKWLRHLKTDGA